MFRYSKERTTEILALLVTPVAVVTISNLIYQSVKNKTLPLPGLIIVYFVILIILLVAHNKVPFMDKTLKVIMKYIISPLIISPLYMVFGNVTNRNLLIDIHKTSIALQEAVLFGRLVELRNPEIKCYHILFTHKDGHDPVVGNLENYKIPGFPVDEAQMIMRLWYFLTNNLNLKWSDIRPICSCIYDDTTCKDDIIDGHFTVVGSPKSNKFCADIMTQIELSDNNHKIERKFRYLMKINGSNCYLQENSNSLIPDTIDTHIPPPIDKILTDYAVIMKLPNLFIKMDKKKNIILFAGCKVGGQCGITEWISDPENLTYMTNTYYSKYFQIIFKVSYNYVDRGLPHIIDTEVVYEEEITLNF